MVTRMPRLKKNREFQFEQGAVVFPKAPAEPLTRQRTLRIHDKETTVAFQLSDKEWNGFQKFLRDTKAKNHLPRSGIGYAGYNMSTDKVRTCTDYVFARSRLLRLIAPEDSAELEATMKKETAQAKRLGVDVRRSLLAKDILLTKEGFSITLTRQKFIRLRTFCLSLK